MFSAASILIYDKSVIEHYNSKGFMSRKQGTLQYCIGEEKYIIYVLQHVRSDLLPYHVIQLLLFVVYLTLLTDPLRIQPRSQDRRNQTEANREYVRR